MFTNVKPSNHINNAQSATYKGLAQYLSDGSLALKYCNGFALWITNQKNDCSSSDSIHKIVSTPCARSALYIPTPPPLQGRDLWRQEDSLIICTAAKFDYVWSIKPEVITDAASSLTWWLGAAVLTYLAPIPVAYSCLYLYVSNNNFMVSVCVHM
jgi:hypothetical protein